MIEHEARDEGRRVGEFETTLALAEALGLPPETRLGPALAEVRRLRAERDALWATVRAHLANLDTCSVCGAVATTKSRADFYHCDKHTREEDRALFGARQIRELLALLPPEAS